MYKECSIINKEGLYLDKILVNITVDDDEKESVEILYYTLSEDEILIYSLPPSNIIKPKWINENWVETATQAEINLLNKRNVDEIKNGKLDELSKACNLVIVNGFDIELNNGVAKHFSLAETDQINISTAAMAIEKGAPAYPYHADGEVCELYSAIDISNISKMAAMHKLYHTTYYNHLSVLVKRLESTDEIQKLFYGIELPNDLKEHMEIILKAASELASGSQILEMSE